MRTVTNQLNARRERHGVSDASAASWHTLSRYRASRVHANRQASYNVVASDVAPDDSLELE